jgi:hypothetical protein
MVWSKAMGRWIKDLKGRTAIIAAGDLAAKLSRRR